MKKRLFLIALSTLLVFLTAGCPAQTITPNIGLQIPAYGSTNWTVPLNYNFNLLDGIFGGNTTVPGLNATGTVKGAIVNATSGFQLNGSYGDSGQCLISTGTGTRFGSCGSGGGMVYPASGIACSNGSGWCASYTLGNAANDIPQLDANGALNLGGAVNASSFTTPAGSGGITVSGQSGCAQFNSGGALGSTGSPCGSGSSPGGSTGNLQYNNAGAFGGDASTSDNGSGTIGLVTVQFGVGGPTLSANSGSPGAGTFVMPTLASGTNAALAYTSASSVAWSATPTYNAAIPFQWTILAGNITSFTLGAGGTGQSKTLCFQQPASGGPYTVTAPANVHGFFTVGTTASGWNCQTFIYYGTSSIWLATTPGVTNE